MNRAQQAWAGYRWEIYGSPPLHRTQERECSLAFYAGMMTAFDALTRIASAAPNEESGSDQLEVFRLEIEAAAARANLDRSDGKS